MGSSEADHDPGWEPPVTMTVDEFRRANAGRPGAETKWEAVICRMTRTTRGIDYVVDLEGDNGERLFTVYRRTIRFQKADWFRAGGGAFVYAAREQEKVSEDFAKLLTKVEVE